MGQAVERQEKVGRELDELLDILSNRRETELGRLVKKLREAEAELSDLRKQQAGLKKKIADAQKLPPEATEAAVTGVGPRGTASAGRSGEVGPTAGTSAGRTSRQDNRQCGGQAFEGRSQWRTRG